MSESKNESAQNKGLKKTRINWRELGTQFAIAFIGGAVSGLGMAAGSHLYEKAVRAGSKKSGELILIPTSKAS